MYENIWRSMWNFDHVSIIVNHTPNWSIMIQILLNTESAVFKPSNPVVAVRPLWSNRVIIIPPLATFNIHERVFNPVQKFRISYKASAVELFMTCRYPCMSVYFVLDRINELSRNWITNRIDGCRKTLSFFINVSY